MRPDFPFAQKLTVPLGARVIFKGDLHGDFRSLNLFVEGLRQQGEMESNSYKFKTDFYLIFLGDYVDRGLWGVEVIHLLMQLKLANPERVFLVRGNHEDPEMANNLGFRQEYEANLSPSHQQSPTRWAFSFSNIMLMEFIPLPMTTTEMSLPPTKR
ncbi:MAG: serine/threonine protein phosphatase [Chlamydiia bacterium]|nr:serine/threonine protein phosphatase [Chlamydiia bacterium]